MTFDKTTVKEYNHGANRRFYYGFYATILVLLSIIAISSLTDIRFGAFSTAAEHITTMIQSGGPIGVFYLTGIGGLFVFTFPIEAFYVNSLAVTPALVAFPLVMLGVVISYTANYYAGKYVSGVVKPFLGPRTFYTWSSRLSRYGPAIIVLINIIPMVSQAFTAVLGVFNYNKTRTALYTVIGQVIKFGGLTIATQYI